MTLKSKKKYPQSKNRRPQGRILEFEGHNYKGKQ